MNRDSRVNRDNPIKITIDSCFVRYFFLKKNCKMNFTFYSIFLKNEQDLSIFLGASLFSLLSLFTHFDGTYSPTLTVPNINLIVDQSRINDSNTNSL